MVSKNKKIVITGTGCALIDFIYTGISFCSPVFQEYWTKEDGDGGLCPGKLVFTEELEHFSGKPFELVLEHIAGGRESDAYNLGGPGLVSLIHATQLLGAEDYQTVFYGTTGNDATSSMIFRILEGISIDCSNYRKTDVGTTPSTFVFSDPTFNEGNGERCFTNNLGVAQHYSPNMLGENFYHADIVCLGGTALVPLLHDDLSFIVRKAKKNKCITIVNTVYDFRNERMNPGAPWPLVHPDYYSMIDILVMDLEEALRISGKNIQQEAISFFIETGVQSFIITNGESNTTVYARGGLFIPTAGIVKLPVSVKAASMFKEIPENKRDTTGCGDNFAGGVIASVAWQLKRGKGAKINMIDAASWGVVSGGLACSFLGGTYFEKYSGEKRLIVDELYRDYFKQITTIINSLKTTTHHKNIK